MTKSTTVDLFSSAILSSYKVALPTLVHLLTCPLLRHEGFGKGKEVGALQQNHMTEYTFHFSYSPLPTFEVCRSPTGNCKYYWYHMVANSVIMT